MNPTPKPPRRNEPCWCGSGEKYKRCHLNRGTDRALPFQAIATAIRTATQHKLCFHPEASHGICDQIVSAHTIQRAGVLARLVDEGHHVLQFPPLGRGADRLLALRRIGWRDASTFPGFCARHDAATFAPLETCRFTGTPEQCFLLGYRALCHELYQKRGSLRAQPVLRRLADQGRPLDVQTQLQHEYSVIEAGTRRGLGYFERLKSAMDSELLTRDYSRWTRTVIRFRGDLGVACAGVVSPNRDLTGYPLQVLHDPSNSEQEPLLCGVVPLEHGGAVVFSWLRGHTAPRRFLDSVLAEREELPDIVVQFFFAYISNTCFSPRWWSSLSEEQQRHLRRLASLSNAYYTDFPYLKLRAMKWEIEGVEHAA